jgi:hypothetical protein
MTHTLTTLTNAQLGRLWDRACSHDMRAWIAYDRRGVKVYDGTLANYPLYHRMVLRHAVLMRLQAEVDRRSSTTAP